MWGGFSIRRMKSQLDGYRGGLTAQACPLRVKIHPTWLFQNRFSTD
jgi:hypothetical protein